jgi:hypothetical protein
VPKIVVGDVVSLDYLGSTYTFVVNDTALVDRDDPPDDFLHGDLMIQTSWIHGQVLLVYAEQVVT